MPRTHRVLHRKRSLTATMAVVLLAAGVTVAAYPGTAAATPAAPATGPAPGRPGEQVPYLAADKGGFGTAHDVRSKVWFTLEPGGGTGEIYYPNLGTPATRALGFVVVDG